MEPQVVLPGEVAHVPKPSTKLGPGLAIDNKQNKPFFCKAGAVKRRGEESVWLHSQKKRYVPSEGEKVIGVVVRSGRVHRINIGSSHLASLPELAFEGATKRNKVALQIGDLVYARLSRAHKDCEPELTCIDSNGKSNGLGVLKDEGTLITCSLMLCRQLLSKSCPVLSALGKYFKFECTVGFNGRVLVSSQALTHTIVIRNCIIASEYMDSDSIRIMVDKAALTLR